MISTAVPLKRWVGANPMRILAWGSCVYWLAMMHVTWGCYTKPPFCLSYVIEAAAVRFCCWPCLYKEWFALKGIKGQNGFFLIKGDFLFSFSELEVIMKVILKATSDLYASFLKGERAPTQFLLGKGNGGDCLAMPAGHCFVALEMLE